LIKVSDQSVALNPQLALTIKLKGEALKRTHWPFSDQMLSQDAHSSEALAVRARARFDHKEFDAALADAEAVLSGSADRIERQARA